MKRVQGIFSWVVVLSELSHVFCCVLPSIFTIVTIFVGMGMVGAMPLWMDDMHHAMHDYEIPLIAFSGGVLVLGWLVHVISNKIECQDTGCCHEPCAPKKKKAGKVLKIATFLFLINVTIYFGVHYQHDQHADHGHHAEGHHDDEHHDDHHHDH